MFRKVNIVDDGRVEIYRVETFRRTVDHLQSRLLLNRKIDEQRSVHKFSETLQTEEKCKYLNSVSIKQRVSLTLNAMNLW